MVSRVPDRKDLEYRKVLGTENPADMMTKHLLREPLDKCMKELNQWRMSGRAKSGLDIQGSGKALAGEARIGSLRASGVEKTARRVHSQPGENIVIPSWKEETKAMNYRSEACRPRAVIGTIGLRG